MIAAIVDDLTLSPRVREAALAAADAFVTIDPALRSRIRRNVVRAFLAEGINESDLAGTTGYGYDDAARARYESLLCRIFATEAALARLSLVSGTQAIVMTLAACVPHGGRLLSVTGTPYDTLHMAIAQSPHSLVASGVRYDEVALQADGGVDHAAIRAALAQAPADAVFVQRSRGYHRRPSLSIADCAAIVQTVKASAPQTLVLVDNCYGELVEEREPTHVGADAAMGSLIKNLGGGIAPTGGYVAGTTAVIERVASRLYAPGLGAALGPTLGLGRLFFQGLFVAPVIIEECLRGLNFTAALYAHLGYRVDPAPMAARRDTILAIDLGTRERLIAFARGFQAALPVNARFAPEPGPVPGYDAPVLMSSGAFVAGATIELSCDAPLRAPYTVFVQGGMVAEQSVVGAVLAAEALERGGL